MRWFLIVFFLVYGGAHLYALLKAKGALGFGWGTALLLLPVLAALTCGPLIVYSLSRHGMEGAARAASWIAYTWLGLLFLFLWMNLAVDLLNLLVRVAGAVSGSDRKRLLLAGRVPFFALVGLSLALGAYATLEARQPRVERVRIATEKLPASTPRLRIVQISDVHLGLMVRHRYAREIAETVRRERPDLFVSTGDLVDAEIDHLEGLAEILREIRPRLGMYAVTGNHEYYAGIGQALAFTERAGFTLLRGKAITIGGILRIAGVDDPTGAAMGEPPGRPEPEILGDGNPPLFTLLLKHRPRLSGEAKGRFDLQLSGHTHFGQLFPFRLLVRIPYPLLSGLHRIPGGGALYVSRGTGTWGPRMRFLSPPEITVIDLVRSPPRPPGGPV
ncbi:MAG: metallophosphoesterase [Deltaproteobacteria bacterium]